MPFLIALFRDLKSAHQIPTAHAAHLAEINSEKKQEKSKKAGFKNWVFNTTYWDKQTKFAVVIDNINMEIEQLTRKDNIR